MNDEHAVDALVTALHPGVGGGPIAEARDVVLVTGPWLAGSTSVTEALGQRLAPDLVEAPDMVGDDAPAGGAVCSAVAPLTESDCVLLDAAAANTDLVVGAVSKIDVHRGWRDVLAANRAAVAAHDARYADMAWVGVAAAPELGERRIEDLARVLDEGLAHPALSRRNRLRAWESRLGHALRGHEDAPVRAGKPGWRRCAASAARCCGSVGDAIGTHHRVRSPGFSKRRCN